MDAIALALDLVGTFVFALSGALVAVRKGFDLFGMVVLSVVAGLGGGMTRDVLLGATPPNAFRHEEYLLVAMLAAVVGFFFHPHIGRLGAGILVADALGLGLVAVAGTAKSLDAGLDIVPAVLLGVVTGSGGGVLRDLLASQTPLVLQRDIYALAACFGATLFAAMELLGFDRAAATPAGIAATFGLRLLAIRYGWQAPRPRVGHSAPDTAGEADTLHEREGRGARGR